ncbi:MAG: hypothetical protein KKH67_04160 [candidate division Zixibacteria bacterium]|nr:hypothetical protein [candidate division Zixibacteria bacterium]MBU1470002.1 hypothetical protein [candidate division Zixibacteria bacterium]
MKKVIVVLLFLMGSQLSYGTVMYVPSKQPLAQFIAWYLGAADYMRSMSYPRFSLTMTNLSTYM